MISKNQIKKSKYLSLILRHDPGKIGVSLDAQGWIKVNVLLDALDKHGKPMSRGDLETVVRESDKKRFAFSEDGTQIRANQGHSVEVDMQLEPAAPPETLYHGTSERFIESIRKTGLDKMERHHVHLSADLETARKVGSRRGKPAVLEIRAGDLHRAGHISYVTDNGVWLVEHVPTEFIRFPL